VEVYLIINYLINFNLYLDRNISGYFKVSGEIDAFFSNTQNS
jgi:hypothetical protein